MHHTQGMQRSSVNPHVAIITHDDFTGNCTELHLTQCFQELGLTFEIISLAHDPENQVDWGELTLTRKPYTKKIVDSTEKFKHVAPDLMIFLCHGKDRGKVTPSGLCFFPEDIDEIPPYLLLYASDTRTDDSNVKLPHTCVTLQDVTAQSKLAIVSCCHGDMILKDFKSTNPKNFTDMLLFVKPELDHISFCIFHVLLFNLVDCDVRVRGGPAPKMHEVVKDNIRQIFKLISAHGNSADEFWTFLENHDCVTSLEEVKNRQGFTYSRESHIVANLFQVSGIAYNFALKVGSECKKTTILQDFKAMKLVCWDEEQQIIVEENWESSLEEQLTPTPPHAKRSKLDPPQMSRLLESLKLTA